MVLDRGKAYTHTQMDPKQRLHASSVLLLPDDSGYLAGGDTLFEGVRYKHVSYRVTSPWHLATGIPFPMPYDDAMSMFPLLCFWMGTHSLPFICWAGRSGAPQGLRLC